MCWSFEVNCRSKRTYFTDGRSPKIQRVGGQHAARASGPVRCAGAGLPARNATRRDRRRWRRSPFRVQWNEPFRVAQDAIAPCGRAELESSYQARAGEHPPAMRRLATFGQTTDVDRPTARAGTIAFVPVAAWVLLTKLDSQVQRPTRWLGKPLVLPGAGPARFCRLASCGHSVPRSTPTVVG